MNLFKKLFRSRFSGESNSTTSQEDLEKLLEPLVRQATKINVLPASAPPDNSQLHSHFGGQPYFEVGESWPLSKAGTPLQFVFQVFNNEDMILPETVKLVQFFYDFEADAFETADDGWLVKTYGGLDLERVINLPKPEGLEETKYCEVNFETIRSLPDWEGLEVHSLEACNLSCALNEDEPWQPYEQAIANLLGEQDYGSQLGGYPTWVQGDDTPAKAEGYLDLLFQIDSEENAGLMWGDVGLIYVFYEPETKRTEFVFQCH